MSEKQLTATMNAAGELATERLDHWATTTPDRVFLYYGEDDVTVTFAEAKRRVDAIAGNLAAAGIEKGHRVSVFTKNAMVATLCMYGIWRAGAVYAPVNFAFSGRLLDYQLRDTGPQLVITDGALLPALNEVVAQLPTKPQVSVYIAPPGAHDHVASHPKVNPEVKELPWATLTADRAAPDVVLEMDDPAQIIYTSGTTGAAKGVLLPWRQLAQYTYPMRMLTTPEDVVYNDLPMYHVGGATANVMRAHWMGAECAIWDRFSPTEFWNRIAKRKATSAIFVDVMMPWLLKVPESPNDRNNTINKVHMQPLPLFHNAFAKRFGIDFVTAGFGQTESGCPLFVYIEETTQDEGTPKALYRGKSHDEVKAFAKETGIVVLEGEGIKRKGFMGLPVPFFDVTIRNDKDEECGVEEAGHLALRPKLPHILLKEYIGKPEATLTAMRNLWFHTGDAALKGRDGYFYFVDRLGDRMRVRGENLSSFEVEDLLNQHPSVQMTAVVAIRSTDGDEDDVVAFAVAIPDAKGKLTPEELHAFALKTMPKHMRPRHIRVLDDLPKTPTNKVEKYNLRKQIEEELGYDASQRKE